MTQQMWLPSAEAYLEPCQASMIERFVKTVNGYSR